MEISEDIELQRLFEDTQALGCLDVSLDQICNSEVKQVAAPKNEAENAPVVASKPKDSQECEEGEVEHDVAEYINSKKPGETLGETTNDTMKGETTKGDEEIGEEMEEDNAMAETMEDSDPLSSSSEDEDSSSSLTSDDEDWRAIFTKNENVTELGHSDEDEDHGVPPRTKNEVLDLPFVPRPQSELQPYHNIIPIGKVSSKLDVRVIVEGDDNHSALDESSVLWLVDHRVALGFVDEVFGPVKKPFYVVRFNDMNEIPAELQDGARVGFVPEFAKTVLNNPDLYKKGYDASGVNDEELSEHEEFSDDEKEAEYKRLRKIRYAGREAEVSPDRNNTDARGGRKRGPRNRKQATPAPQYQERPEIPYRDQQPRNVGGRSEGTMNQVPAASYQGDQTVQPGFWSGYYPGNYQNYPQQPPMGYAPQQMQGVQYQGYHGMHMATFPQGPPGYGPVQGWYPPNVPLQYQGQPSMYQGQPSTYEGQPSMYQGQPSSYPQGSASGASRESSPSKDPNRGRNRVPRPRQS